VNDRLTRWLEEEEGPNSSNIQQYSRLPREALLGGEDTEAVQAKWLEQVMLTITISYSKRHNFGMCVMDTTIACMSRSMYM
jgi:hypothetical protein